MILFWSFSALTVYILGTLLAYIAYPVVDHITRFLRNHKMTYPVARSLAIITLIFCLFAILFGVSWFLGDLIVKQFSTVFERLQQSRGIILDYVDQLDINLPQGSGIVEIIESLGYSPQEVIRRSVSVLFSTINVTFAILLGIVLTPFWIYYIMYKPETIKEGFLRMFPASIRDDVHHLGRIIHLMIRAYLYAQLKLSVMVFIAFLVGYTIIGMDNALTLALIAGVLEFIPIFGALIAWLVGVVVAVPQGVDMMIWVSVVSLIIQQIEGNILVPRIQGGTINLPTWVVMLTVTVAGALFGFIGMVIGLPLVAVVKNTVHYLHLRLSGQAKTPKKAREMVESTPFEFHKL